MMALARTTSLLLILMAATGSPAWCWAAVAAPLQGPTDQPARLTHATGEPDQALFLGSRSTSIDMTWLARRAPLVGMMAGQKSAAPAADALAYALIEIIGSFRNSFATSSLISLHSQLTV